MKRIIILTLVITAALIVAGCDDRGEKEQRAIELCREVMPRMVEKGTDTVRQMSDQELTKLTKDLEELKAMKQSNPIMFQAGADRANEVSDQVRD